MMIEARNFWWFFLKFGFVAVLRHGKGKADETRFLSVAKENIHYISWKVVKQLRAPIDREFLPSYNYRIR